MRPRLDANNTKHDDIYIINSDGSGGHWARAVPSPWHLGDPSWSPDGSRLLVTVTVSTPGTWAGWIWPPVKSAFNGGGFNYPGLKASYDRSGQKIVYVGSGSKTVEQINADGTGIKVLVSSTFVSRPAYSPDGKKVAYSRLISTGDEELFVKNLVDGTPGDDLVRERRQLTDLVAGRVEDRVHEPPVRSASDLDHERRHRGKPHADHTHGQRRTVPAVVPLSSGGARHGPRHAGGRLASSVFTDRRWSGDYTR